MRDAAPPNRFRRLLVGLVVLLSLAFAASLFFRLQRTPTPVVASPAAPEPKPVAEPTLMQDNGLERARRAAAVAAIESGDYQSAIDALSAILKKGKGVGDEIELLRIAKELDSRAKGRPTAALVPPAPTPVKPKRTGAAAAKPSRATKPAVERPAEGQLLVFSVPNGLEVEVDGSASGTTPLRLPMASGTHLVVVLKNGLRLQDRTVVLAGGDTSTVDFDVREKLLAASKPVPPISVSEPAPVPPEPLKEPELLKPVAEPAPTPVAVKAVVETPKPQAASDTGAGFGEVFVAPSSLGGEVFINGRAYGPGPLLARDIRVGEAVVELRANGETKRRKEVAVKKDQRAEVRFR
jgi:PEGA domain